MEKKITIKKEGTDYILLLEDIEKIKIQQDEMVVTAEQIVQLLDYHIKDKFSLKNELDLDDKVGEAFSTFLEHLFATINENVNLSV